MRYTAMALKHEPFIWRRTDLEIDRKMVEKIQSQYAQERAPLPADYWGAKSSPNREYVLIEMERTFQPAPVPEADRHLARGVIYLWGDEAEEQPAVESKGPKESDEGGRVRKAPHKLKFPPSGGGFRYPTPRMVYAAILGATSFKSSIESFQVRITNEGPVLLNAPKLSERCHPRAYSNLDEVLSALETGVEMGITKGSEEWRLTLCFGAMILAKEEEKASHVARRELSRLSMRLLSLIGKFPEVAL
jgi:hypothetical protein